MNIGCGGPRVTAEPLTPRYARDDDDNRIDALFIGPMGLPRRLPDVRHG